MIEVIDDYHFFLIEPAVARFVHEDEVAPVNEADEEDPVETKVVRRGRPPKAAKAVEDGVETK